MLYLKLNYSGWRIRKQAFFPFRQMDQYCRQCCESETLWCGSESWSLFSLWYSTFPFDAAYPAPYQSYAHLPPLIYRTSKAPFWSPRPWPSVFPFWVLSLHIHSWWIVTLERIRIRLLILMRSCTQKSKVSLAGETKESSSKADRKQLGDTMVGGAGEGEGGGR